MIEKIDRSLESAEKVLLVIFTAILLILSFVQVCLRQFCSTGILWGDTFLRHGVLWVGFMGAQIAAVRQKHFAIDFLRKRFSVEWNRRIQIALDIFSAFVLVFLSKSAAVFLKDELENRSILFLIGTYEIPAWWIDSIIPLGFCLMTVHFAMKAIQSFNGKN